MQSSPRDESASPSDCALADLRALQSSLRRIPSDEREPFIALACQAIRSASKTRKRAHVSDDENAAAPSPTLPTRRRCADRFEEHVENALRIMNSVRAVAPTPLSPPRQFLARPVRFCPLPCTREEDEEENEAL